MFLLEMVFLGRLTKHLAKKKPHQTVSVDIPVFMAAQGRFTETETSSAAIILPRSMISYSYSDNVAKT